MAKTRQSKKKAAPWMVEYRAYLRAVKGPPVMIVLRTHLLTEYYLERIIRAFLPRGDKLVDNGNFSYAQKLAVVESFDTLPDTIITALKNLNRLRNRCAHEFDRQVSIADIDIVGGPFGTEYTEIKRKFHASNRTILSHTMGVIAARIAGQAEFLEEPRKARKRKHNKALNTDTQQTPRVGQPARR